MEKEKKSNLLIFALFAFMLVLILTGFLVHAVRTGQYNRLERTVSEREESECTVELYPRGGIADSWDKRDVLFRGKTVTFTGTTYDCTISNYSDSAISDWTLKIDICKECYINNSWCGTVEIHQKVKDSDKEIVQELDLRDYKDEDILLDHFYIDQDLYVSLDVGDYLVYKPSEVSGERPVSAFKDEAGKVTIGFIFYHVKNEQLSFNATMQYKLTRSFFYGPKSKILLACLALWILLLVVRVTFILTFSNLKRETNSVIHAVSAVYTNLYKVNLKDGTFQEIRATQRLHDYFAAYTSPRKALQELPPLVYSDESQAEAAAFYDVDSWRERLKNSDTDSVVLKSRDFSEEERGRWYQTNLIVCKRDTKNEPLEIICGLLDVDREVREREEAKLMTERYASDLRREVAAQTLHIQEIQNRVVSSLGDMIGSRDGNTGGHVKRTSDVIQFLVEEIIRRNNAGVAPKKFACITKEAVDDIIRAAPMHDLGKIFIDTSILCKPGKLTVDEYEIMKTHSSHSGDIVNLILKNVEEEHFVQTAFNVARYHHERWDGTGYPEGKAGGRIGEGIPLESRIMAVADVYDALVSKRCYKKAMSFEQAYAIMLEGMGSQFDPDMKDIFIACREKLEQYYAAAKDE